MKPVKTTALLFAFLFLLAFPVQAQMVTGVWHGKINGQKVEAKIIKSGDSITGTSYYYASARSYRRYTIKGYFDEKANEVVWWDDKLVEEKSGLLSAPGKVPLLSRADFNCPGGGVMKLDGTSNEKNEEVKDGEVHLQKIGGSPVFNDEWDWVIDNFTVGANDPYIIDSVSLVAFNLNKPVLPKEEPTVVMNKKRDAVLLPPGREEKADAMPETPKVVAAKAPTIQDKFTLRQKKVFTTVPIAGDSVSLSFYDNAIVDGDSISLFLDGRMIFTHIKLAAKPYTVTLSVADLKEESELVMVAENLGDIPPNTAYMVAVAGGRQYSANLASTEESSAVVRLKKPSAKAAGLKQ